MRWILLLVSVVWAIPALGTEPTTIARFETELAAELSMQREQHLRSAILGFLQGQSPEEWGSSVVQFAKAGLDRAMLTGEQDSILAGLSQLTDVPAPAALLVLSLRNEGAWLRTAAAFEGARFTLILPRNELPTVSTTTVKTTEGSLHRDSGGGAE